MARTRGPKIERENTAKLLQQQWIPQRKHSAQGEVARRSHVLLRWETVLRGQAIQ
jgi:hypothetical protein